MITGKTMKFGENKKIVKIQTTYDVDWKTLLLRRLNRECAWGDMEPTWASKRVKELEKGK